VVALTAYPRDLCLKSIALDASSLITDVDTSPRVHEQRVIDEARDNPQRCCDQGRYPGGQRGRAWRG
jgi:hypothetical protein